MALPDSQVTVNRTDLAYLLAHYWDEVLGRPDRGHWQLPLLRDAAGRLTRAVSETEAVSETA